jgi:uncharacterized protein YqhQ
MASFYYGGQAVIEGVMMRGQHQATVVVRSPEGVLRSRTEFLPANLYRHPIARLPFVRGLVVLWEMLVLGTRLMLFSAGVQARIEQQEEIPRRTVAFMILFSLTFAVLVFFVGPLLLARAGAHAAGSAMWGNVIEGVVRLLLFMGYLFLIGRIPKMHRVFQYHGAEHKTVNAYEAGAPLTPTSVQKFSTIHIRCGTAFLLWVVVLSILVFGLLGHPPILVGVLSRILLVPVIAACSYEILRLGARFYGFAPVRFLLQPGLWLQRLTTREPTDDQVEVAIAALVPVLQADGVSVQAPQPPPGLVQPQFGSIT